MRSVPSVRTRDLTRLVWAAACVPAGVIVVRGVTGRLGANPIERVLHDTGWTALLLLVLSLSVTPVRRWLGWPWLAPWRRLLGLAAFFYGALHVAVYLALDRALEWNAIFADLAFRPYIIAGALSFALLIPLALTSTRRAMQRLGGRQWTRLHRLVYVSAAAAVVHFWWLVKADIREPRRFAIALAGLMLARVAWAIRARHERHGRVAASGYTDAAVSTHVGPSALPPEGESFVLADSHLQFGPPDEGAARGMAWPPPDEDVDAIDVVELRSGETARAFDRSARVSMSPHDMRLPDAMVMIGDADDEGLDAFDDEPGSSDARHDPAVLHTRVGVSSTDALDAGAVVGPTTVGMTASKPRPDAAAARSQPRDVRAVTPRVSSAGEQTVPASQHGGGGPVMFGSERAASDGSAATRRGAIIVVVGLLMAAIAWVALAWR